ncbi:MAG: sulfite exporter TauE/SafE family protein [Thiothrix sp.]|nr:sulfite exporter TauE/SafE family protein [Thiothrix sp.]HPQ96642.1 sulfite exporter TauE/SafE family protein [Thiolinea sp.]
MPDSSWIEWLQHSRPVAAFLTGLLGGVHCLGMCGGIVAAMSMGTGTTHPVRTLGIHLGYNLGRITTYTLAGAVTGGLGTLMIHSISPHLARLLLQGLATLFMLVLGLYLAGIWPGLRYLEQGGQHLWRRLEPLGRHLLPINHPLKAFPFGLIWGWLPCGMVYSILIWSLSAGSSREGALLMLAFGLGTLPNLLLMGLASHRLLAWVRKPQVRRAAGLLVVAMGLMMLAGLVPAWQH